MADEMQVREIMDECIPLFRRMISGRYSITVGGSRGKGTSDSHSDVDFRLYYDSSTEADEYKRLIAQFKGIIQKWKDSGVHIDGCWIRKISDIDNALKEWTDGVVKPVDMVWTIWGYHILTDIYNQQIIEDPFNVAADWKKLLSVYPAKLKTAIIEKHMSSLRYWRSDYHYANKVRRGDAIFLAGISSRLVHDMAQVIFALNETYFTGDGNNITYIDKFTHKPAGFGERTKAALYPANTSNAAKVGDTGNTAVKAANVSCVANTGNTVDTDVMVNVFEKQQQVIIGLIDDLEKLVGAVNHERY